MRIIKSFLVIGLCLALAGPALAQPGAGPGIAPGGGGMGRGGGGRMLYNPQTVTTVKGVLQSREATTRRGRMGLWVVKTDQGDVTVHLGPPRYLDQQQVVLNPGAAVEVTGSKLVKDGKTLVLAREITVAGKILKLRDDQGLPLWRTRAPAPAPAPPPAK